jgi:hypothetical protein
MNDVRRDFQFCARQGDWRNGLTPRKFAGNNAGPNWTVSGMAGGFTEMKTRFTIDGSRELEDRLERICGKSGAVTDADSAAGNLRPSSWEEDTVAAKAAF